LLIVLELNGLEDVTYLVLVEKDVIIAVGVVLVGLVVEVVAGIVVVSGSVKFKSLI
jgi:hypothetical protein